MQLDRADCIVLRLWLLMAGIGAIIIFPCRDVYLQGARTFTRACSSVYFFDTFIFIVERTEEHMGLDCTLVVTALPVLPRYVFPHNGFEIYTRRNLRK